MSEKSWPDDGITTANDVVAHATPDPKPITVPSITGGLWLPRRLLLLGVLAAVVLGVGLTWIRHADVAEQRRLEAQHQRAEDEIRKRHEQDRIKRDQQLEQDRIQREREQAVQREDREQERQKHEAQLDELRQHRNWLEVENQRLRQELTKPKRVYIVR